MSEENEKKPKGSKYVAVKVEGYQRWLWFKRENVTRDGGRYIGKGGWGLNGAHTEIDVDERLVQGEMASEGLQHDEE